MIRVFNICFPARTLFLGVSEWIVVFLAFTLSLIARAGRDADLVLADEHGIYKVALVAGVYLLCMYYLDLYDTKILAHRHEVLTRILQVLGLGTIVLAVVYYSFPGVQLGRGTFLFGLFLALPCLLLWREAFPRLVRFPAPGGKVGPHRKRRVGPSPLDRSKEPTRVRHRPCRLCGFAGRAIIYRSALPWGYGGAARRR